MDRENQFEQIKRVNTIYTTHAHKAMLHLPSLQLMEKTETQRANILKLNENVNELLVSHIPLHISVYDHSWSCTYTGSEAAER